MHNRVWIGVIRIVGRVIEVRDALDPASFGQQHRLGEHVYELPVEVIPGNAEQGAGLPSRIDHLVDEVLAAKMHMRHQIYQLGVRPQRELRFHFVVRITGRNGKQGIHRCHGNLAPLGGLLGEDQSDGSLVGSSLAGGCIVQLDHVIRACRKQLGHARRANLSRHAWRVAHQKLVAKKFEAGFLWIGCGIAIGAAAAADVLPRYERYAGLSAGHPLRPFRPNERDYMMHRGAIPRPDFGHLHPFVL